MGNRIVKISPLNEHLLLGSTPLPPLTQKLLDINTYSISDPLTLDMDTSMYSFRFPLTVLLLGTLTASTAEAAAQTVLKVLTDLLDKHEVHLGYSHSCRWIQIKLVQLYTNRSGRTISIIKDLCTKPIRLPE